MNVKRRYTLCVVPFGHDVQKAKAFYQSKGYFNIREFTASYIPGTELVGDIYE